MVDLLPLVILQSNPYFTMIVIPTHGLRPVDRSPLRWAFSLLVEGITMIRTKFYIDGFNLYHSIDSLRPKKPHLKWVNLWGLCNSLLIENQSLTGVEYFSAFKKTNLDRLKRHEQYVEALKYYGVSIHMGIFKRKYHFCRKCHQTYIAWEEKETDVHLAVKIVEDAFTNQFDTAVVISADTDLIPPIQSVQSFFPDKNAIVIAPPKRMARCRSMNPVYEIPVGKISKNLLPDSVLDSEGTAVFTRPVEYDPPEHTK